jgi:hypothetical protein
VQIKIIGNYDTNYELEQAVNQWLKENLKCIYFIDMKYSDNNIVILYEERKDIY